MTTKSPLFLYIFLFVAAIAIYGKLLLPNSTFGGMDFVNLGLPRVLDAKQAVLVGELPLWNHKEWGGGPLLATMLGAVSYPFMWLVWFLPLPWGLQIFVFLHLMAGGIGAALCGKQIFGLKNSGALFGAAAYLGSAFFLGRLEQFQVIACNVYLPWLTLALYRQVHGLGGTRGAVFLPMVTALMLLAGHPQFAFFNICGAAAVVGLTVIFRRQGGPGSDSSDYRILLKNGVLAGILFAVGVVAASPQILPTKELADLSERVFPYPDPLSPSLEWRHLPAFFVSNYYGILSGQMSGRILGFTEQGLYMGVLPVVLALCGVLGGVWKRDKFLMGIFGVWAVTMLYALGNQGGIAPFIVRHVDFLNHSRGTARILNVSAFLMAMMAGCGFQRFTDFAVVKNPMFQKYQVPCILIGITIIDLAVSHRRELNGHLIPAGVVESRLRSVGGAAEVSSMVSPRMFRFMHFDSDYYLDNSPAGVAERFARFQPNLIAKSPALVDGYEEGLLPTLEYANFLRRFNRNLRSESPDAALLALLRTDKMMAEYPVALNPKHWGDVVRRDIRPAGVMSLVAGEPAVYTTYASRYSPAVFLDKSKLEKVAGDLSGEVYQTGTKTQVPPGHDKVQHPLTAVSAEEWNSAVLSPKHGVFGGTPNSVSFTVRDDGRSDSGTTLPKEILWTQTSFPGWKIDPPDAGEIRKYNSFLAEIRLGSDGEKGGGEKDIRIVYRPFAFRLGLFMGLFGAMVIGTLGLRIKTKAERG